MKYIKTYEKFYLYNIGDYCKIKNSGYDQLTDQMDVWYEDIVIDDRYNSNGKNIYYYLSNTNEFNVILEDDIIRKLTKSEKEEFELKIQLKKYNL